MSVILRKRKNSDGTTSLYLDIYYKGRRAYEFLKELKLCKPANPVDRMTNKDNLDLANKIAVKRAQELSARDYTMVTDSGKKTIIVDWMQTFVDSYRKKDKRNLQGALNRFKDFLLQEGLQGLTFGRLDELIISNFQDYLVEHSTGEGPSSYFARFKKMVKQAFRQKLILTNPALEVRTKQGSSKKKDVLTMGEIQLLSNTSTESTEVRRAFIFSLVTGLRWIDVKGLLWGNINVKERQMKFDQSKVKGDSKAVLINLNETAVKLLGKKGESNQHVFDLPTANGANKTLKAWVKRAGIGKQITWHNARHSFGTNLVFLGTDINTASNLLGHSSLKYTQRYVRAANELKERATDKLNIEI
jgi:site-specific recombinase XerD